MPETMAPSDKQTKYAMKIADSLGEDIPEEVMEDRHQLSQWIDEHTAKLAKDPSGRPLIRPSLKQQQFAEKIREDCGVEIPKNCYDDSRAMSQYIDEHMSQMKHRPTDKMIGLANKIHDANPDTTDPSTCFEDFDKTKEWIDANFPAEWRNGDNGDNGGTPKRRARGKSKL